MIAYIIHYVTLCNLSLCFQMMQDCNSYLHFRQGLKTFEQIFGQSLQIIVGQTPGKEEKWIRNTAYCIVVTQSNINISIKELRLVSLRKH